jgi:hypothetical protein
LRNPEEEEVVGNERVIGVINDPGQEKALAEVNRERAVSPKKKRRGGHKDEGKDSVAAATLSKKIPKKSTKPVVGTPSLDDIATAEVLDLW